MRHLASVVAVLGTLVLASPVLAQSRGTVRVIAERAEIRLRADPNSIVLASVAAGSVLTVVGQEGAWLAVAIPQVSGSSDPERVGYLSTSQAETFGVPARTLTDSAVQTARATSELSASQDGRQLRLEEARRRRSSGKKKLWTGVVISGAAAVVAGYGFATTCDAYACYSNGEDVALVASYGSLGGGVLGLWGLYQWISASGDVSDLTAPAGQQSSLGALVRPTQLSYSVRW